MKSIQTLDNLRDIKATADGSSVGFQTPQVQDGCLQDLKQLTLMHIPSSVTEEARSKFKKLILETFKGNILHNYLADNCSIVFENFTTSIGDLMVTN